MTTDTRSRKRRALTPSAQAATPARASNLPPYPDLDHLVGHDSAAPSSPRSTVITCPLEYWKTHSQQFPYLSSVAKDILSIPGSSVAVERLFNCGRDVIGLRRHSLKPETLSALMFGKCALMK